MYAEGFTRFTIFRSVLKLLQTNQHQQPKAHLLQPEQKWSLQESEANDSRT